MDIGLKITIGAAAALGTAAAIVNPTQKQKETAAFNLFDKPWNELSPQESRVAEFKAGHQRWVNFFENTVYPVTRSIPGSKNPILNPYKDVEPMGGGQEDEE